MILTKAQLLECQRRITPFIHRTPLLTSHLMDEMVGAQLVFKCENFQKTGAFKMRGATNAILQLNASKKAKGVVTHSSGNFAQALALAARTLGVKVYVVMPHNAPCVKVEAVENYGGIITFCDASLEAREKTTERIVKKTGAVFVHPSNNLEVILGNSTVGMELLQEVPDLERMIAPVGGGGLIAGTALVAHFFSKHCQVIGAEPKQADDAYRSMQSGKIETNATANTIADGLKTNLGTLNFPIILKHVERIITVEESEIIQAMKLIYERLKIVIEPSSAVAFAAVLKEKENFKNKKIAMLLSGGNVDLNSLPFGR